MKDKKNVYIAVGLAVLGLVTVYFLASYVVPRMMVTLTKAAPATKVSVADSYVLGERILAKADGKDKCVINVFIMDKTGKGVAGKRVSMEGAEGIAAITDITDNSGKASFAITSAKEGKFPITASVEGVPLVRQVTVTFRN